jgi:predicted sugar kinase
VALRLASALRLQPTADGHTGDELALVYRHRFAEDKNVFIIIPSTVVSSAGRSEFDLLMNRARNLDYQDRELKAYLLLMDLIPALEKNDLKRIGDVVWEIEFRSKRAEGDCASRSTTT